MGKYFGTDGVRGEANVELTPELAFKLGPFRWLVCWANMKKKHPWYLLDVIRVFWWNVRACLNCWPLSVGIRVYKLGVIATPGAAYLVLRMEKPVPELWFLLATIQPWTMASNSFGGDGFKLMMIANLKLKPCLMLLKIPLPRPSAQGLGTVMEYPEGWRKYQEFLVSTGVQLEGMHVVLDTAMVQPLLVPVKSLQIWELNWPSSVKTQMVWTSMMGLVLLTQSICKRKSKK